MLFALAFTLGLVAGLASLRLIARPDGRTAEQHAADNSNEPPFRDSGDPYTDLPTESD
jgi:hypothetical protein